MAYSIFLSMRVSALERINLFHSQELETAQKSLDAHDTSMETFDKSFDVLNKCQQSLREAFEHHEYLFDTVKATNVTGRNPCRPSDGYHVDPHTYDNCPS